MDGLGQGIFIGQGIEIFPQAGHILPFRGSRHSQDVCILEVV